MKINLPLLLAVFCSSIYCNAQQTTTRIFDEILFYDGYATVVDEPVPAAVIRHRNDLYSKRITPAQLASFGDEITMNVIIKAACDNYDRIGNLNLALVPKNRDTYTVTDTDVIRIELGRYITPFMNKNRTPNTVPYSYELNNISRLFRDKATLQQYNIWLELEVFGVPYSAHTQIAGCAGRNDVFYGSVDIVSNGSSNQVEVDDLFLSPLLFKHELNNYQQGASDAIGQTKKTISFDLENTVYNAKLYLITSNHGAGEGGEEYVRREHYVYFDQNLKLQYKPGGLSCEPFRIFNTQANGIYGSTPRSDASWAAWNNWCPGDVIPTRIIDLGTLNAGTHSFVIDVPQAEFRGNDGKIPVSLYLQGHSKPYNASVNAIEETDFSIYPNPTNDFVSIQSEQTVNTVVITDLAGKKVGETKEKIVDLSHYSAGVYILNIKWDNGTQTHRKVLKN